MKTTKQFSILMAIVLLSFSIISCKEELIPPSDDGVMLRNNTITLYVDTGSVNKDNLDSTCNFGQKKEVSNEDFTTLVQLDDEITWVGKSSSSPETDLVEINLVKYDGGKKILNKRKLRGDTKVVGKVENGNKDDVEKYKIKFTVFNNGIRRGKYKIDPKLQIN